MSLNKYRDEIKGVRERMESQAGDLEYKQDHIVKDTKEEAEILQLRKCAQQLICAEDHLKPVDSSLSTKKE